MAMDTGIKKRSCDRMVAAKRLDSSNSDLKFESGDDVSPRAVLAALEKLRACGRER